MATSSTKPRRSLKRKQTYTKDSEHSEPAPKRARTTKGPSITWEKFYMSVAQLESQRSNCAEHNKAGVCIVSPTKKVVAVGHSILEKDDDTLPKYLQGIGKLRKEFNFVSYAAINAILNKSAENVQGCTIYMTKCPTNEEAKVIIQAGITEVIYFHDDTSPDSKSKRAKELLTYAKVWHLWYGHLPTSSEHLDPSIDQVVFPLPQNKESNSQNKRSPKPRSKKHPDYDENKDHFMAMACLASLRSKDPKRQVGACIVDKNNKIVSFGYNGFPTNISDDDPRVTWGRDSDQDINPNEEFNKYLFVVHAEVNAIMYRNCVDLEGCTLYTTLFPCLECAKVIIRSGIKNVYYLMDDQDVSDSKGKQLQVLEWDDSKRDAKWRKQKDCKKKVTYVASRCLLQKKFASDPTTSTDVTYQSQSASTSDSDHQSVPLRICKRYIPSRKFTIKLEAEHHAYQQRKKRKKGG